MSETNQIQAGKEDIQTTLGNMPEGAGGLLKTTREERLADAEAIQEDAPEEVVEQEEPAAEVTEEAVETEESDEDAWLSDDDEGETVEAEPQEDDGEISESETRTLNLNGQETEVTADQAFDFYQRMGGRQEAIADKEQELADRHKQLDVQSQALEYFQVEQELAPEYYAILRDEEQVKEAKVAWSKGEEYNGLSEDKLKTVIDRAEFDLKERIDNYKTKASQHEKPGRELLQSKQPDISSKGDEYFASLETLADEFGYSAAERQNADFRQLAVFAELADLRAYKDDVEQRREAYAKKREAERKQGKVATKSTPPKSSKQAPDPQDPEFNIDDHTLDKYKGDGYNYARDLMKGAGSALRR